MSVEKGNIGESKAQEFLEKKGYQILEKNWRMRHLEIDLIARTQSHLVFIEVKLRNTSYFGEPHNFVTLKKQKLLIKAANLYLEKHDFDTEIRFDVIGISNNEIKHFEDAFRPY